MIVKLMTEHHLVYLSLKGGCTVLSESIHVKMPHCWKSHVAAHKFFPTISGSTELTRSISVLVRSYKGLVLCLANKVSKGAKIKNRYNQVPHLTQDTNGKVTNSQIDTTNKSQEVNPFPAGDHKAHINRHVQRHSKHKTEKT